jgi:hypothetical protein
MASVAIASFGRRCGLMDSATVLFPTVEYHVAVLSGDPILEINIPSGFGRGHDELQARHDCDYSQRPAARASGRRWTA